MPAPRRLEGMNHKLVAGEPGKPKDVEAAADRLTSHVKVAETTAAGHLPGTPVAGGRARRSAAATFPLLASDTLAASLGMLVEAKRAGVEVYCQVVGVLCPSASHANLSRMVNRLRWREARQF